tara:strand:- start:36786 stop:37301 length:516 start_codon:yes stop_codon:yes gene_type:complete
MVSEVQKNATDAGDIVVDKATNAARAVEDSRSADTASLLAQVDNHMMYQANKNALEMERTLTKIVEDALGKNPTRYIDVSRIPLICKSIMDISENMKELKAATIPKETVMSNKERIAKIEHEIDKSLITKKEFSPVASRVENIESNQAWIVKIIVGAVLAAVLGLVLINVR